MGISTNYVILGGVKHITIDGLEYEVYGPDGVTIECRSDTATNFLVGTPEPRVRVRNQTFVVSASLPENTFGLLALAWYSNRENISYIEYGYDYLELGVAQTLDAHVIEVCGYDHRTATLGIMTERLYHFHRCLFYDPQPQELRPNGVTVIPIRLLCVADISQPKHQAFGWVRRVGE